MHVSPWVLAKIVGGVPCPSSVGRHHTFNNNGGIGQTPITRATPLSFGLPRNDGLLMQSYPHPLHSTRRCGLSVNPSKHGQAWMLYQQQQRQQPLPADTNNGPVALLGPQWESSPSSGTQPATEDRAERMFAIARSLHLRRHRSKASRRIALKIFRETLRLRPAWKVGAYRLLSAILMYSSSTCYGCSPRRWQTLPNARTHTTVSETIVAR